MHGYIAPLSLLEIHLDRVRWNYLFLQKRLKKGADCAAVVKADAYGLGAAQVVPELYKANCRHFYVGHAEEGQLVREALKGRAAQIYVLHGPSGAAPEEFQAARLTPVLNTPGDVEYWSGVARKTGQKKSAVLQIDTGMNRLGLTPQETAQVDREQLRSLDLRYIMSHLACADTPDHPKNREQLEKFKRLTRELGLPCALSFANSAGIFLGEDYHFDQARPGCALYGINPQPESPNLMRGVLTLKARILQIRNVDSGETVGYGASYQVSKPAKLATISAGYADGLLRNFSKGGFVHVGGVKCPVVGRVSMDTLIVDVTETGCVAGDWAEIIGQHQTADDVAEAAGTIGYEILTGLGRRYKRIYSGQEE